MSNELVLNQRDSNLTYEQFRNEIVPLRLLLLKIVDKAAYDEFQNDIKVTLGKINLSYEDGSLDKDESAASIAKLEKEKNEKVTKNEYEMLLAFLNQLTLTKIQELYAVHANRVYFEGIARLEGFGFLKDVLENSGNYPFALFNEIEKKKKILLAIEPRSKEAELEEKNVHEDQEKNYKNLSKNVEEQISFLPKGGEEFFAKEKNELKAEFDQVKVSSKKAQSLTLQELNTTTDFKALFLSGFQAIGEKLNSFKNKVLGFVTKIEKTKKAVDSYKNAFPALEQAVSSYEDAKFVKINKDEKLAQNKKSELINAVKEKSNITDSSLDGVFNGQKSSGDLNFEELNKLDTFSEQSTSFVEEIENKTKEIDQSLSALRALEHKVLETKQELEYCNSASKKLNQTLDSVKVTNYSSGKYDFLDEHFQAAKEDTAKKVASKKESLIKSLGENVTDKTSDLLKNLLDGKKNIASLTNDEYVELSIFKEKISELTQEIEKMNAILENVISKNKHSQHSDKSHELETIKSDVKKAIKKFDSIKDKNHPLHALIKAEYEILKGISSKISTIDGAGTDIPFIPSQFVLNLQKTSKEALSSFDSLLEKYEAPKRLESFTRQVNELSGNVDGLRVKQSALEKTAKDLQERFLTAGDDQRISISERATAATNCTHHLKEFINQVEQLQGEITSNGSSLRKEKHEELSLKIGKAKLALLLYQAHFYGYKAKTEENLTNLSDLAKKIDIALTKAKGSIEDLEDYGIVKMRVDSYKAQYEAKKPKSEPKSEPEVKPQSSCLGKVFNLFKSVPKQETVSGNGSVSVSTPHK